MSVQQAFQSTQSDAQQPTRALDRDHRPLDFRPTWLRTDVAVVYLGYRGKHARRSLYRFIQRKGIRTARRSHRCLLVNRLDIDRAIGASGK